MAAYEEIDAGYHECIDAGEDGVGIVLQSVSNAQSVDRRRDLHSIAAKAGGVTITTMKLKIQFAVVEMALAGALMSRGVISAG